MGGGTQASCDRCKFEFTGGHSHDSGSAACLCLNCFSNFECVTASRWGPEVGEVIPLFKVVTRGKKRKRTVELVPTGVTFVAEGGVAGEDVRYPSITYPISNVPCPECHTNSLVLGFDNIQQCPKCREGTLTINFVEH